jgi:DNA-binding transcriptional LysR family regulator
MRLHYLLRCHIIHAVNVSGVDLNLLPVLDAVLEVGGVGGAAARLGLSQPAVSNALRRLQESLDVKLFTRHGRRLVPTPAALALAPVVRSALASLDHGLFRAPRFEPRAATGTFTLAISDYWHAVLLPVLIAYLDAHAPGVRLDATPTGEDVLAGALPRGDAHAAIFLHPRTHAGVQSEILISDDYLLVVGRRHPFVGRKLDMRDLAEHRHVVVAPPGPWAEELGQALRRERLVPRIVLVTPQVRVAMDIVSRTDCIAVLPRGVASRLRSEFAVRLLPLPIRTEGFKLALYWHDRCESDPLQQWLRSVVVKLARQVYGPSTPPRAHRPSP